VASFIVDPKRTIRDKSGQIHRAGSEVSPDKLGISKKEFDSLVKDGTVIQAKDAKKQAEKEAASDTGETGESA